MAHNAQIIEFKKGINRMIPQETTVTKPQCFLAGIQTGINLAKSQTTEDVNDIYKLCEQMATQE
jgi:hypothetical protein